MWFNPTVIHSKDGSRQNGSVHSDHEQSDLATVCVDLSIQKIQMTTVKFYKQSKKISNDQELIQSDPTSCPQNQKGNNYTLSLVCIWLMVDSRVGLKTCGL